MADQLLIHGLEADCRIGVTAEERATPQKLWIDLTLEIEAKRAARRDEVGDAVDYAALVDAVRHVVQQQPFTLLETLAEHTAALILKEFTPTRVTIRVKKRALPGIDFAAVELTRP